MVTLSTLHRLYWKYFPHLILFMVLCEIKKFKIFMLSALLIFPFQVSFLINYLEMFSPPHPASP